MTAATRRKTRREVPTRVALEGPATQAREAVEDFVRNAFSIAYGASIRHFMPELMTLRSDTGQLLAALGLRQPDGEPLFLERYLQQPVERVLAQASGTRVTRDSLVEVGNFAVGAAGGGRWLITALTACLYSREVDWTVFTCGPELRNAFTRLGVELLDLGEADPSLLDDDERAVWGSYYAQRPHVMAANVAQSHQVLSALFDGECALNALWRHASCAGRMAA